MTIADFGRSPAAIYLPEVIVLGGGVAIGGGEGLLARARRVMAEHLRIVPVPRVRLSRLGLETALRGAVALAMRGPHPFSNAPARGPTDSPIR